MNLKSINGQGFLELLNELHYQLFDLLLMMLIVNVIKPSINGQNFDFLLSVNPFFVSLMHTLNVFQTDLLFSFSVSDFYPLKASLWRTLQVNDTLDWAILNQSMTNLVVNCIFVWFKVSIFIHDLSKNISIRQRRSLGKENFILLFFYCLLPKKSPWMKGIELKSKAPSFRIIIIFLQYVNSPDIFP